MRGSRRSRRDVVIIQPCPDLSPNKERWRRETRESKTPQRVDGPAEPPNPRLRRRGGLRWRRGSDRVDKHRRQEAACQDGAGGEHQPGIPVLAVAIGFVSPSRRLRCQLTLSGRSFKQAPRSHSSCERAGSAGDWAGCKADKAIALVVASHPSSWCFT